MKKKTNENIDQATETAGKAVATAPTATEKTMGYSVKPSEIVSIVANDRLLFFGTGLTGITITEKNE